MDIIIIGAIELGFIYSLMTLGLFVSYRILNLADMTVDGSFTTGAAVSAVCTLYGHPVLGVLLAIPAGALAGLCTSFLQTKLKVQPILAGILTMTALYSVNLRIMEKKSNLSLLRKETIFSLTQGLLPQGFEKFAKYPVILLVVALASVALYLFLRTPTGLAVRATGDNVDMVRASSINPHATNAVGLCIANALVALSGGVLAQYQQSSDISLGVGVVVIGLASLIIGEVLAGRSRTAPAVALVGAALAALSLLLSLTGWEKAGGLGLLGLGMLAFSVVLFLLDRCFGSRESMARSILAVMVGAIVYRIIMAIALNAAVSPYDLKAVSAIIVALAISYPAVRGIAATYRLRKEGKRHA